MAFTHYTVKKIIHGSGSIKQAPKEVKNLGGSRVLIVMDPGLAKLGVQKPLEDALTEGGVAWELFAKAELEPSMDSIQACADAAAAFNADVLIGFGGGSALDTTKAASVLLSNEGPIDRYFGTNLVPNPTLPKILIPTTAGTGSEMTNISVLADTKNGGKKGVVSEYMYAEVVLLDAALTVGLPPRVTAMTGVDAFVHAMESYCGIAATPITDALNLAAMKLVGANIQRQQPCRARCHAVRFSPGRHGLWQYAERHHPCHRDDAARGMPYPAWPCHVHLLAVLRGLQLYCQSGKVRHRRGHPPR